MYFIRIYGVAEKGLSNSLREIFSRHLLGSSNQIVLPWSALRPTHPCVVARWAAFKCYRVSGLSLRASRSLGCDAPHRSREPTSPTSNVHYPHNGRG